MRREWETCVVYSLPKSHGDSEEFGLPGQGLEGHREGGAVQPEEHYKLKSILSWAVLVLLPIIGLMGRWWIPGCTWKLLSPFRLLPGVSVSWLRSHSASKLLTFLASRSTGVINEGMKCSSRLSSTCCDLFISRLFYLFSCSHKFHTDCLGETILQHLAAPW